VGAWGVESHRSGGLGLPWIKLMCDVSMFPAVRPAAVVPPGRLFMGGSESWSFLVLVPVVVFVTPLAPRPADCRVVAAPRLCVASRAGIRIVSQEFAKSCMSELSVLPPDEETSVEGLRCKKMVLPAAIRGKSQR